MGPTLIRNNMLTSSALNGNGNGNGRAMSGVGERVNSSDAVTGVLGVLGQVGSQMASAYGQPSYQQQRSVPGVTLSNVSNSALVNSGNAAILGHGNLNSGVPINVTD
jgi:hypothetical protein